MCVKIFLYKKTNHLPLADCRHLVHLFSCRCLQMWSADCRHFPAEKTNNTLVTWLIFMVLTFNLSFVCLYDVLYVRIIRFHQFVIIVSLVRLLFNILCGIAV
ncbi:hypothetical protein Hanom_Chr08g00706841 [Helianthus anomalus]